MTKSLWINLPVKDLNKSKEFFITLGFKLNLQFGSREDSACFLVGDSNLVVMLFEKTLYEGFVNQPISLPSSGAEVLFSLDAESVAEVDEMAQKVLAAGGKIYGDPGYKDGWMYGFGFIDLDGQKWNILYMDMNKMPLGED